MQMNFGAALRSAFFLGAAGVLSCARNSSPLSPVVSKASSGALELMAVHSSRNLPRTLAAAAAAGWQVLGALST
jgi:21S rRNA (GM2251-2'-O)-methyltransferase